MSEREDGPDDKDPAPLKHSDAERNTGDDEQPASPAGEDEPADDDEQD